MGKDLDPVEYIAMDYLKESIEKLDFKKETITIGFANAAAKAEQKIGRKAYISDSTKKAEVKVITDAFKKAFDKDSPLLKYEYCKGYCNITIPTTLSSGDSSFPYLYFAFRYLNDAVRKKPILNSMFCFGKSIVGKRKESAANIYLKIRMSLLSKLYDAKIVTENELDLNTSCEMFRAQTAKKKTASEQKEANLALDAATRVYEMAIQRLEMTESEFEKLKKRQSEAEKECNDSNDKKKHADTLNDAFSQAQTLDSGKLKYVDDLVAFGSEISTVETNPKTLLVEYNTLVQKYTELQASLETLREKLAGSGLVETGKIAVRSDNKPLDKNQTELASEFTFALEQLTDTETNMTKTTADLLEQCKKYCGELVEKFAYTVQSNRELLAQAKEDATYFERDELTKARSKLVHAKRQLDKAKKMHEHWRAGTLEVADLINELERAEHRR